MQRSWREVGRLAEGLEASLRPSEADVRHCDESVEEAGPSAAQAKSWDEDEDFDLEIRQYFLLHFSRDHVGTHGAVRAAKYLASSGAAS